MAGAAAEPGTRRWLPASSTPNGEMPLIAARCVSVVPYRAAMPLRVSPHCTVMRWPPELPWP